eukprot:TRINITY_DN7600_c0_g1_i3.p1 TRINITY_DN7600_c0_g1~~TRINITY_DN7600_c0_g1_i3.p1  ORF type:complete len:332 (+),score=68.31 TRINITY_DN7600_c0_g1_i3:171-1166(+)
MTETDPAKLPGGPVPLDKARLTKLFDPRKGAQFTGLELGFHGHPYVAEQFIKAHAILQELAKFVQIIIKAERCAAGGGDLLVYGFANKQMNALFETYRNLVKTIRSQFEVLTRIAELRFQQLVERNQAEPERNTYIPHYRFIHTKFYHFDNQLIRTEDCVDEIISKANSLTLYERFNKLKQEVGDFISSSDLFAGHLHNVLHLPYNPVVGQKVMVQGPSIPDVEMLLSSAKNSKKFVNTSKDVDILPAAFELLESTSIGTVKIYGAPPELLLLTQKGEEEKDKIHVNQFTSRGTNERLPVLVTENSPAIVVGDTRQLPSPRPHDSLVRGYK